MAQKVEVRVVCDMDHEEQTEGKQKVSFGLDGRDYEIDLCAADARKLRRRLQKYLDHARKHRTRRARGRAGVAPRRDTAEIRAWAKSQGIEISPRGRIPAGVVRRYEAAHAR